MNFITFIFCATIFVCNLARKVMKYIIPFPLYCLYVFSNINISNALWSGTGALCFMVSWVESGHQH